MAMMGKIRSMHFRQGKSISEIARLTSLSRNTIKKWLKAPQGAEPKYGVGRCRRSWRRSSRRCIRR
jgi:transposase